MKNHYDIMNERSFSPSFLGHEAEDECGQQRMTEEFCLSLRKQSHREGLIACRCESLGISEIDLEALELDFPHLPGLDAEFRGLSTDGESVTLRIVEGFSASISYHTREQELEWAQLDPEEDTRLVFRLVTDILDEVEAGGLFLSASDGSVQRRPQRGEWG